MIERKAIVFSVQKYNTYDGPGVRTIVFFKGCPLRCKWCSNPESQLRKFQVMYKQDVCVNCGACVKVCPTKVHQMDNISKKHNVMRDVECVGCRKCEQVCPVSALKIAGEEMTISELVDIVEEDRPFYEVSGGGLTLGGGEALMQPEAIAGLLMACKQRHINTAIETCGYAKPEVVQRISELVDLFLYDIKHMDSAKHNEMTGVRNELILSNLTMLLENGINVMVRVPLVKGFNDGEDNLKAMVDFLLPYQSDKNFKGIDLLPYHKLGVNKYKQLDLEYPILGDPSFTDEDLSRIESYFKNFNFNVSIIRH